MAADDVSAIVSGLPEGTRILSEVIRGGGEPVQPEEYTGFGEVFEFTYARDLGPQLEAAMYDPSSRTSDPGMCPRHPPSSSSTTTTPNAVRRPSPTAMAPLYLLANVLLLADDYGTPVVYSGYAFDDRDAGAPADADGPWRRHPARRSRVRRSPTRRRAPCVQGWTSIAGMLNGGPRSATRRGCRASRGMPTASSGKGAGWSRSTSETRRRPSKCRRRCLQDDTAT